MKKNSISKALALCCIAAMAVGTLALFSDNAELPATAKVGNLAVGLSEAGNGKTNISDQLVLGGTSGDLNGAALNNWNPGDSQTFVYTVSNDGNKAIRAEETLTLKVTATGKNGTFTNDANADVIDSMITIASKDGSAIKAENVKEEIDGENKMYTLTYNLDEFALTGKAQGEADVEALTAASNVVAADSNGMNAVDATKNTAERTFTLVFDKAAKNVYQDANIEIVVHVDAIQFANSSDIAENGVAEYVAASGEQETVYTTAAGAAVSAAP